MEYGLRVKDSEGNIAKITPLVSSIIASGTYTSPTTLNDDNTYGFDIDLPGTNPIPIEKLAVICKSKNYGVSGGIRYISVNVGGGNLVYLANYYANTSITYYIMSVTDPHAMSIWTAGNQTINVQTTWDPCLAVNVVTQWLQSSSETSYTAIRIFSAVSLIFLDGDTSDWATVYILYGLPSTAIGVVDSDVSVIIKEWNY